MGADFPFSWKGSFEHGGHGPVDHGIGPVDHEIGPVDHGNPGILELDNGFPK